MKFYDWIIYYDDNSREYFAYLSEDDIVESFFARDEHVIYAERLSEC